MKALMSVVSVIALLAALFLYLGADETAKPVLSESSSDNAEEGPVIVEMREPVEVPDLSQNGQEDAPTGDAYIAEMIARMKAEFGETIVSARSQVSLKEFRDDLILNFPGEGADMFEAIVRGAFPAYADSILALIKIMDSYESWLVETMPDLNELDLTAQQDMLWDKRIEMFGDKAEEIWDRELSAKEERDAAVLQTVSMLDGAHDIPMDERLTLLQQAFDQGYGQSVEGLVYDTTGVMSQVFFRFESVQRDLEVLSNDERQEQIDEMRRQMGFDEIQIASMAESDQKKESRWSNGYAYMEERNLLLSQENGDSEVQEKVTALREKYFGKEAHTIGKEEDELGFFRYERPRVYGWN